MKKLIVSIGLCAMLVLSACQPTPEQEIIVGKGDGVLNQKALEEADQSADWTQDEDRIVWSETRTVNTEIGECSFSVSMDAKLPSIPDKVPVFLIQPKEFSMDFLENASKYLMKGDMYYGKPSKQDIEMEILDAKKDFSTHTIRKDYQSQADEWLEFLNERYNKADDSNSDAKYEFDDKEFGIRGLHLKSYPKYENSIMDFQAHGECIDNFYFRVDEFHRSFQYLENTIGESLQAKGTQTTYEQALDIADKAMTALFDVPFMLVQSRITDTINHNEYLWSDEDKETSLRQSYVFYYNREYDDIPSLYIDPAPILGTDNTEYAKPYTREYALIVVDDRGIAQMRYESFSETIEKLNENVKMMPFAEVFERFKSDVFYHNIWGFSADIQITRIDFGLVREPVKDNPNQYMMVPAWNFVGHIKNDWFEEPEQSILALSAIDGSIITDYQSICDPK